MTEEAAEPPQPECLAAVKSFERTVHKHNKPYDGFVMGTGATREAMGKGKSLLVCTFDMLALTALVQDKSSTREAFPVKSAVGAFRAS